MIKQITHAVLTLAAILLLTACGGGSSTDSGDISEQQSSEQQEYAKESLDLSEYNQNIVITTVDDEGTPISDTWVQWIETDATATEMIDAVCIDEGCTTWVIDQFPTTTIHVKAIKYVERDNDSLCHDVYEGETYVDASIQELQEIQIIVEQIPSICE